MVSHFLISNWKNTGDIIQKTFEKGWITVSFLNYTEGTEYIFGIDYTFSVEYKCDSAALSPLCK